MSTKFIDPNDVVSGDLLLFFKRQKTATEAQIANLTGSQYTHAGICIEKGKIAHQTNDCVVIQTVGEAMAQVDHAAVFRRNDLWSEGRLAALRLFVTRAQAAKTSYNLRGFLKFLENRTHHLEHLQDDLNNYFDGTLQPESSLKGKYHCSEFVVACFTAVGIIDPSAAIVYRGSVIAPGELGRDATFGFFDGYVTPGGQVPPDDEFINEQPYSEILKQWNMEE
jgi:hypothetical protein